MREPRRVPLVVAAALLLFSSGETREVPQQAPLEVSAWIVDWNESLLREALQSVRKSKGVLTEIDLFRFRLSPDGQLTDTGPFTSLHRELLQAASERNLRRMATLVNDTVTADGRTVRLKDPALVHDLLGDPNRRAHLIAEIRAAISEQGFDGLDLDFEDLHAADREPFSEFVAELAGSLHRVSRRLVVTVHPQARPEQRDGPGAEDLAALAAVADEIRVMAYHYRYAETDPGPAAPAEWVRSLIEYTLTLVPPQRISLALYVGGWRWNGKPGLQISFSEAKNLAHSLGVPTEWSAKEGTRHFRVSSPEGTTEVWYEDACSLALKTSLAERYHLRGIALWHLAAEDPDLFAALRSKGSPCRERETPRAVRRPEGSGRKR